jgi:hypothetical protein
MNSFFKRHYNSGTIKEQQLFSRFLLTVVIHILNKPNCPRQLTGQLSSIASFIRRP